MASPLIRDGSFHAVKLIGLPHGEPPFRHLGLGVALSAVHDRSAMGLVTGGAFQLFVMGPMGVVGAHVSGLLIQIVAGEVVAGLVQAQLVGVAARCLRQLAGGTLDEREVVVAATQAAPSPICSLSVGTWQSMQSLPSLP